MMRRRSSLVSLLAAAVALGACSSSGSGSGSNSAHVFLVGTFNGHKGNYSTIQAAVDAAKTGDWVLIAPGDYHEQYDHTTAVGDAALGAVYVTTAGIHIRGMDRNRVIIDGTKPGSPTCSRAPGDQDFGPVDAHGKPVGRNGLEVWKADSGTVENLTACNFLTGSEGGGNQIWWNGGDGSGTVGMHAYSGQYLSATSSYAGDNGDGSYGIFVSNSSGPGSIAHTYASNMSDASYYVGACPDCNVTIDDAHAQYSALGYSGTNSGGHLIVENSEFDHNKTGFSTNSQNNDDAPSPQDGACPNGATGPTGSHSCWVFRKNFVHDNNNADVPGHGSAELGPPGTGLIIAGGRNDTVVDNRFEHNGSWGVIVVPFPDTGTPPKVAHCEGGDPNGVPSLGLKGCFYAAWGNEVAHNTFAGNGSFGNPTNGDIAEISSAHDPGNCWHDNTDPAGLTSAPPNLQQTNGTCGVAHAGAGLTSDLTGQVVCATEVFGTCEPAPGKHYPRRRQLVLPALAPQTTMPNPCDGVPSNSWCHGGSPVQSGFVVPLLAVPAAVRPRRRNSRARSRR